MFCLIFTISSMSDIATWTIDPRTEILSFRLELHFRIGARTYLRRCLGKEFLLFVEATL